MAKNKEAQPAGMAAATKAPVKAVPAAAKVHFDAWWAMTEKKIPPQHHKEIVMADFRARGLSHMESIQSYNEALKRYGVKLK